MRALIASVVALACAAPSYAQSGQPRSTRSRVGWTLAGIGIGFGAGLYVGFNKFDQATYAERKITTTAIAGAAAGGVIAFLLARNKSKPRSHSARGEPFDSPVLSLSKGELARTSGPPGPTIDVTAGIWSRPFQLRRP